MASSLIGIRNMLRDLLVELDGGAEVSRMLGDDEEEPEDVAKLVQLMGSVASALTTNITNFFNGWDFTEDCRRGALKEAAKEPAAAGTA